MFVNYFYALERLFYVLQTIKLKKLFVKWDLCNIQHDEHRKF